MEKHKIRENSGFCISAGKAVRGSDILIQTLSDLKVPRLFTLSGNQIMSVFDASLNSDINLIHFRQEGAVVHAADTLGRLTGEPSIALVTAGPGFANCITALYVALCAESPLVLISGHSQLSEQGKGAFQEMPQADMARAVTKASWTSTKPENIRDDIVKAYNLAGTGRPGPVHVAVPEDVLKATVHVPENNVLGKHARPDSSPINKENLTILVDALESSERPVALVGQSISRVGHKILSEVSTSTGLPVIDMESPRGINDPSLGAFAEILPEADLVVLLGKKLDYSLKFGGDPALSKDSKIIHVDFEESAIAQSEKALASSGRLILGSIGDPLKTVMGIQDSKRVSVNHAWTTRVQESLDFTPGEWEQLANLSTDGPLHPTAVCKPIQRLMENPNFIFVSDGGEFGQWTQACVSTPNRIINGPGGAIGASIPAAIAARISNPNATVIAMLGDGSLGFHGIEFDTAVRYNLPFIAIIGNDARWNAEYQIQLNDYGRERTIGCELSPTRYDLMVKALGGHGENVENGPEFVPALERAIDSGLPACINVAIQPARAPIVRRS